MLSECARTSRRDASPANSLPSELPSHVRHRALYASQIQHIIVLEAHVVLALIGTLFDETVRLVVHPVPSALSHRVRDEVDSSVPGLLVGRQDQGQQRSILGHKLRFACR